MTEETATDARKIQINSPWSDELVKQLLQLRDEKYSCRDIAAAIGVSRNSVIGKLTRLGFGTPKKQLTQEQKTLRLIARREKDAQRKRENPQRRPVYRICPSNGHDKSLRIFQSTTGDVRPLRCAPVEPLRISLLDLTSDTCRYPDGEGAGITFCGHQVSEGSSYCSSHYALCFIPVPQRRAA